MEQHGTSVSGSYRFDLGSGRRLVGPGKREVRPDAESGRRAEGARVERQHARDRKFARTSRHGLGRHRRVSDDALTSLHSQDAAANRWPGDSGQPTRIIETRHPPRLPVHLAPLSGGCRRADGGVPAPARRRRFPPLPCSPFCGRMAGRPRPRTTSARAWPRADQRAEAHRSTACASPHARRPFNIARHRRRKRARSGPASSASRRSSKGSVSQRPTSRVRVTVQHPSTSRPAITAGLTAISTRTLGDVTSPSRTKSPKAS